MSNAELSDAELSDAELCTATQLQIPQNMYPLAVALHEHWRKICGGVQWHTSLPPAATRSIKPEANEMAVHRQKHELVASRATLVQRPALLHKLGKALLARLAHILLRRPVL